MARSRSATLRWVWPMRTSGWMGEFMVGSNSRVCADQSGGRGSESVDGGFAAKESSQPHFMQRQVSMGTAPWVLYPHHQLCRGDPGTQVACRRLPPWAWSAMKPCSIGPVQWRHVRGFVGMGELYMPWGLRG